MKKPTAKPGKKGYLVLTPKKKPRPLTIPERRRAA